MNRNIQNLTCGEVIDNLPSFLRELSVQHAIQIVEKIAAHPVAADTYFPVTYGPEIDGIASLDYGMWSSSDLVELAHTTGYGWHELLSVALSVTEEKEFTTWCFGLVVVKYLRPRIHDLRNALKKERRVRVEVSVTVWVDGKQFAREIWDEEDTAADRDDLMFDGAHDADQWLDEADQWLHVTLGEVFED